MFNLLLPRCERCDKRLGPNHDPAACVKRSVSRRHFLMAGGVIASSVAAIVRPLRLYGTGLFQVTSPDKVAALSSDDIIAAIRTEWIAKFPYKSVPKDERDAAREANRQEWKEYNDRHPVYYRPDIAIDHRRSCELNAAILAAARARHV